METIHRDILRGPRSHRGSAPRRTRGLTGLVYRAVRGIARLAAGGVDAVLERWESRPRPRASTARREAFLAALNGVVGDHLAATANPLALPMGWRWQGKDLEMTPQALERSLGAPGDRVVVLVHGLCRNDLQWSRRGHDHGVALARDLGLTPVYLRYNSGLHVSTNGRALADRLEALSAAWPLPIVQLVLIAHSMGGLVARSACHYGARAGHAWTRPLRTIVFLGTPHHGAPAERAGNRFETLLEAAPYAAALGRLGKLRSAGITDLRHGYLVDEDWQERDRFARAGDARRPVPLPVEVDCHAIAASQGRRHGDLKDRTLGDGLVPLASALGEHADPALDLQIPAAHRWIAWESSHFELLASEAVYEQVRRRVAGDGEQPPKPVVAPSGA